MTVKFYTEYLKDIFENSPSFMEFAHVCKRDLVPLRVGGLDLLDIVVDFVSLAFQIHRIILPLFVLCHLLYSHKNDVHVHILLINFK